jgi:hypothetical protein
MRYHIYKLGHLLAISVLGTCLTSCMVLQSKVTSFHAMPAQSTISGSILIIPGKGISPSLELQSYAARIYSHLSKDGLTAATSLSDADYIGVFTYGIDSGRNYVYSTPIFGQTGGGTTFHSGSVYGTGGSASYSGSSFTPATFGITGSRTGSDVLFTRVAELSISRRSDSKLVWQGRNVSSGSSGEIAQVLPTMIQALLKDFPGQSGKTRFIELPLQ